jgi:hypothetical protein
LELRAHIGLCSQPQTSYEISLSFKLSQGSAIPMKIRKAVFPVAGLGTRVLPATSR